MNISYSYPREERLKSKKLIKDLFDNGLVFKSYPIIFFYKSIDPKQIKTAPPKTHIQIGVSVPKRHFKSAVKRNRIKRQLREVYRTNKSLLFQQDGVNYSPKLTQTYIVMMVFVGKKEMPYNRLNESFQNFIQSLVF